jgi:uncharacterized protein (TIGR03118 family)
VRILRMEAKQLCGSLAVALALSVAPAAQAQGNAYQQHNLVSDGFITADHTDPNLVNAWGISFNPFGLVWVADNGTGVSTLYDGAGNAASLVVSIPSPSNPDSGGNPTGIVFNASNGFVVTKNGISGASRFIFATEDGVIAGWAPNVDGTHAVRVIDNSPKGTIYKALALSAGGTGSLLYAADFHNNKIDVYDSTFKPVTLATGAFTDPHLPAGFAPFGMQQINGDIYIAYAKQDADAHDEVAGKGLGFVDVYDPNGNFLKRVVSGGKLNAPWGLALAPAGFGKFGNRLLVGNFGDGRLHAYDLATGQFVGTIKGADRRPIEIEGLWGIAFGNGFLNQPVNTLFFAAGPGDEKHGLYGRIDAIPGSDSDDRPETDDAD